MKSTKGFARRAEVLLREGYCRRCKFRLLTAISESTTVTHGILTRDFDTDLLPVRQPEGPTVTSEGTPKTATKSVELDSNVAMGDNAPLQKGRTNKVLTATRGSRNGALDGLRGLAVIAVMAYHVVPDPFTGGWLGVDIFFVLSGFLICAMLLREQERSAAIDYTRFLIRRARRLLPGLILMLLAILAAAFTYETAGRRKDVSIDVLSSLFQVSNWRLILANESYFAKVSVPSPIRHTWSLGVQEQFYFIFPLLLIFLFKRARSWKMVIVVFGSIAALSTWRMLDLYVPGTDPSRVYFGTDTRLVELLIGVLGAIWLHQRTNRAARMPSPGPRGWNRQTEVAMGWLGLGSLALIVYWMFTVNEFSPWLFQGGLLLIGVLTLVVILAATSPLPNIMTKLLANKPLMVVGDQSYSLYIWHWPIIIYLVWVMPEATELARQIAAVVLTIVISTLSHRLVERPIHQRGLRNYIRGFPRAGYVLTVMGVSGVLLGSGLLYTTEGDADRQSITVRLPADPLYGTSRDLLPRDAVRQGVVLVGASTAMGMLDRGKTGSTPDIYVYSSVSLGCTPYERDEVQPEGLGPASEECVKYRSKWVNVVEERNSPIVVFFVSTSVFADFKVDGGIASPGEPAHDEVLKGIFTEFEEKAMVAGASKVAIINMACHDRPDFGNIPAVTRSNDIELTKHVNSVIDDWASQSNSVVFDHYGLLCADDKYFDAVNGVELYDDGLHFTEKSAPIIWQWLAHEIRKVSAEIRG